MRLSAIVLASNVGISIFLTLAANPHTELQPETQAAYAILASEDIFEMGIVRGYRRSESVAAFKALLSASDGDAAFKMLVENGSLPGQLYGLCGLYFTDSLFFADAVQPYLLMDHSVPVEYGGLTLSYAVHELVKKKKAVRLDSPSQTLQEWLARHRPKGKGTYRLDIVGGGYPAYLKDHWQYP